MKLVNLHKNNVDSGLTTQVALAGSPKALTAHLAFFAACLTVISIGVPSEVNADKTAAQSVVADSVETETVSVQSADRGRVFENLYTTTMLEQSTFMTPLCSEDSDPVTTIFARSGLPVPGDGSYYTPYRTLAQVIEHLQEDAAIEMVCLKGEFTEELRLDYSILSRDLWFYGYDGGAVLRPHARHYVIYTGFSSNFTSLRFTNLHIAGTGYGGVSLDYVDHVVFSWVTVDASRFNYGFSLDRNGVVEVVGVEVWVSDETYAAISSRDNDEVSLYKVEIDAGGASYGVISRGDDNISLEDVSIEDSDYAGLSIDDADSVVFDDVLVRSPGSYAAVLRSDSIDIQNCRFSGYTYSGLHLEGATVLVQGSTLIGPRAYSGIFVDRADYTLINNNFIRRHRAAAVNVGYASGTANIFNNTFFDNHRALRSDNSVDHELTVTSYNNIFYSKSDQCAYDETYLKKEGASCRMPLPGSDEPMICESRIADSLPQGASGYVTSVDMSNHELRIVSDYNLFHGCVVMQHNREKYFADWTSEWGYGAHSLLGDPRFVSETDLHIRSGSPAISSGRYLGSFFATDIDGELRGENFDIGADEYQIKLVDSYVQNLWR